MNSRFFKALLVLPVLFIQVATASAKTDSTSDKQIRQAMRTIEPLVEFGELYSNGFYFLKKESGRDIIEVRTLLQPCYELVMRVPISAPQPGYPILQTSPAEVELWTIKRIHQDFDGSLAVDREFPQKIISPIDWVKFFREKGDFTSIGINLIHGMEIVGLKEYRDQLRKEAHVGW